MDDKSWISVRDGIKIAEILSTKKYPRILIGDIPAGCGGAHTHLKNNGRISSPEYRGKWGKYYVYHFEGLKCNTRSVSWMTDKEDIHTILFWEPMDRQGCYRGTGRDGFSVMEGSKLFVQLLHPHKKIPLRKCMTDMEYGAIFTLALLCKRWQIPKDVFRLLALSYLN